MRDVMKPSVQAMSVEDVEKITHCLKALAFMMFEKDIALSYPEGKIYNWEVLRLRDLFLE